MDNDDGDERLARATKLSLTISQPKSRDMRVTDQLQQSDNKSGKTQYTIYFIHIVTYFAKVLICSLY